MKNKTKRLYVSTPTYVRKRMSLLFYFSAHLVDINKCGIFTVLKPLSPVAINRRCEPQTGDFLKCQYISKILTESGRKYRNPIPYKYFLVTYKCVDFQYIYTQFVEYGK